MGCLDALQLAAAARSESSDAAYRQAHAGQALRVQPGAQCFGGTRRIGLAVARAELEPQPGRPGLHELEVDDAAALCWYSSHHNFADWAHVWTGTRRHDLHLEEFGHGGVRTYALYTFEEGPLDGACAPTADGTAPVGEPLELFPVDG